MYYPLQKLNEEAVIQRMWKKVLNLPHFVCFAPELSSYVFQIY